MPAPPPMDACSCDPAMPWLYRTHDQTMDGGDRKAMLSMPAGKLAHDFNRGLRKSTVGISVRSCCGWLPVARSRCGPAHVRYHLMHIDIGRPLGALARFAGEGGQVTVRCDGLVIDGVTSDCGRFCRYSFSRNYEVRTIPFTHDALRSILCAMSSQAGSRHGQPWLSGHRRLPDRTVHLPSCVSRYQTNLFFLQGVVL